MIEASHQDEWDSPKPVRKIAGNRDNNFAESNIATWHANVVVPNLRLGP